MEIKVINKSEFELPKYETIGAAGLDLKANIKESIRLKPMDRKLVPTGLFVSIPEGYEGQIRPRSGLALKHGITVLNSPGTIDSDFIGEICIITINLGNEDFVIHPGDRIAQFILNKYERVEFKLVNELEDTKRGECGFGHSGVRGK
jgi:dUTP pyrophosphatase